MSLYGFNNFSTTRQDFFGWVGGWLAGRLRKAENKVKAQHSWGLGLSELGKNGTFSPDLSNFQIPSSGS